METPGIRSGLKSQYRFYRDDKYYWSKLSLPRHTIVGGDLNHGIVQEYEVANQEDREEYLNRLFVIDCLSVDQVRRFIYLGLVWPERVKGFEDYSEELQGAIKWLAEEIKESATTNDLILLKEFDGNAMVTEIADKYGVSHQNISKKIGKIAKNFLKRVRTP